MSDPARATRPVDTGDPVEAPPTMDEFRRLILPVFDARDWYWRRADGLLFGSRRIAYVDDADPEFVEWAAVPTHMVSGFPLDEHGAESVAELQRVLDTHDMHATLAHYAGAVRYAVEVRGVTVTIGGRVVVVSTARDNRDGMRDTMLAIMTSTRKDGDTLKIFTDAVPRPATNDEAGAAVKAAYAHIQAAFNREDTVVREIAAGRITDMAGVEAAFA